MGTRESKNENPGWPRKQLSAKILRNGSGRTQESASLLMPNEALPEAQPTARPARSGSAVMEAEPAPALAKVADCEIYVLDHGGASAEGSSGHENEDRLVICVRPPGSAAFHLFIVIDGHGGELAADYVKTHLPARLDALYAKEGFSDDRKLQEVFEQLDEEFCALAAKENNTSGACVTVAILYKNAVSQSELLVLNVGDCRVIVSDQADDSAEAITTDHTASLESEKKRIVDNGGYVMHGRVVGVMEPSRSVGDIDMKAEAMKGAVVATPEVFRRPLKIGQTTIVLATDGVWSVLQNHEVMRFAKSEINKKDANQNDVGSAQGAAHAVIEESINKDSNDDITVIVVTV